VKRQTVTLEIKPRNKPRGRAFAKGNKHGPRFQKGVSGNPGGRPKSSMLSEAYRAVLSHDNKKPFKPQTNAEAIAEAIAKEARKGKVNAASEVADRVEGKPRQAYEVKLSIMDELAERMERARKRAKK
jgi:hypothetical protein